MTSQTPAYPWPELDGLPRTEVAKVVTRKSGVPEHAPPTPMVELPDNANVWRERSLIVLAGRNGGHRNHHVVTALVKRGLEQQVILVSPGEVQLHGFQVEVGNAKRSPGIAYPRWAWELAALQSSGTAAAMRFPWDRAWQGMLDNEQWRLAWLLIIQQEAKPYLTWLRQTMPPLRTRVDV